MPVLPPSPECNTTFVEVFIKNPTLQLEWNPVNASAPECPDSVSYCVSYRCCNHSSQTQTICTSNTTIKFQMNLDRCEMENQAAVSVQVKGVNYSRNLSINLENNTGMYFRG